MKTKFQETIVNDKETLWKIVKLFHPDIPETITTNKGVVKNVKDDIMKVISGNYDWVTLMFSVKGYGLVSIGIDNCHNTKLWGANVTKQMMQDALNNGETTFNIWRFGDDKLNKPTNFDTWPKDDESEILYDQYNKILIDAGYKLQSIDEWYKIYYED